MPAQLFIFAFAICAAIPGVVPWGPGASWDRNMNRDPHGLMSTVTLRCLVSERKIVDPIYIKTIINNTEYTVVRNNELETDYSSQRYILEPLEHQQDNNIWIIELTIKELTADDSGYFKCVLGNKASSDIYQLKVKVPISEVYFTVINKYGVEERINDTNKSIALKSGEEGGVACHAVVTSGIVKPIIQMKNTGNMSFETIISSMPHEISSGHVRYRTSKQMRFVSKRLDRSLNGRELHCEGWTSGFRAQKKAASLTLNIGFPPVLNCLPTTVYGNIGDTATVSCNVSANPDCRYLELSWGNVGTEKVVTAATSNVASPGIRLSSHENNAINSRIVNFTVTALEEHHFSKKYFLRCHNIYGNAEQQLTVVEGAAPWEISVGTTHLWSAALLLSALLTYTL